jgi:hypothetical protein
MNARHPDAADGSRGLGTMLRTLARIQLRSALVWVIVLGASMIGTAASIAALYDTPPRSTATRQRSPPATPCSRSTARWRASTLSAA